MAEHRGESELTKRLTELRKAIRNKTASVDECLEFMKFKDSASDGKPFNLSESLNALRILRNELPLENAVTFLKHYLDSLDKAFSDNNWLYVINIGFLIAEDLVEMSSNSEAEEEYKLILEWLKEHKCAPAEALATSKLSMLAWQRGSKREAKHYYRKCFTMLETIKNKRKESSFIMPDYQMKFVMEAFVECGKFWRFVMGNHDSAEKFFLEALEYCPKDDEIFNAFFVYSQLHQNERSSKNYEAVGLLPHPDHWDTSSGVAKNILYFDTTSKLTNGFIQKGNIEKNMREFLRNLKANCICQTLRGLFGSKEIDRCSSSLLRISDEVLKANKADMKIAQELGFWSSFLFEKGKSDYRKFKEQTKKIIDCCMVLLRTIPKRQMDYEDVRFLLSSILLLFDLCLREKCYKEAEGYATKALTVAYNYPLGSYDTLMKSEIHFLCVLLNYFSRGQMAVVRVHCIKALAHYRMLAVKHPEFPQLPEQVLQRILETLNLE